MSSISDAAIGRAVRQLEESVRELEADAAAGRLNTMCCRALANAAAVLGQRNFAERALRLLKSAPDSAFFAGWIVNFELPKDLPERLRMIATPEELESMHPPYRKNNIVGRIRDYAQSEIHFARCLEGQPLAARAAAGVGRQLEEVGAALAVLGDFENALSIARDPLLEDFRQRGVLLVLTIESLRQVRNEIGEVLLAEMESSPIGAWGRVHLALGFGGREPWAGYPFPDR